MKKLSIKAKFGWIIVNDGKYQKDIIIHANGEITKREKKKSKYLKSEYGHTPLSERELHFLSQEKFDVLYIGTGHDAALPITPEALEILRENNAEILPTPDAVKKIAKEQNKFVALIHITC